MPAVNRSNTTPSDGTSVGRTGQGYGLFARRSGSNQIAHPTIVALVVMLVLEFAAYAFLRYSFRSVHGG